MKHKLLILAITIFMVESQALAGDWKFPTGMVLTTLGGVALLHNHFGRCKNWFVSGRQLVCNPVREQEYAGLIGLGIGVPLIIFAAVTEDSDNALKRPRNTSRFVVGVQSYNQKPALSLTADF